MIDIIKFHTSPALILTSALALIENHALYQKRNFSHSRQNNSKLLAIQFGQHDHRFVTVKILVTQDAVHRLCGIEANLPAILHGHNGRLIKGQDDMILALTLVRNLVKFLVHPDDHHLILPGREQGNNGFIRGVECPLQLQDPENELLLAAHFTSCRHFQKASLIFPGESICHRSSGLDLAFYDKLR